MKQKRPTIADVLFPLRLDHPYSYRPSGEESVKVGDYVRAPIGPRQEVGVVWALRHEEPERPLRPLSARIDLPPMKPLQRRFVQWVADYYLAPPGAVLRLCMSAREAFRPPAERLAWRPSGQPPERMTPQRARVLAQAEEGPPMTAAELAHVCAVSPSVVRGLIDAGALAPLPLPREAPFARPDPAAGARKALSAEQQEAGRALVEAVRQGGFSVTVLDGVTGSGKTEVYFEAMAEALSEGRQVLLLLPEIALTGQFIRRVSERFAATPAEWHSEMSQGARARVFRAVASGEARIVVAARSGLFLPWRELGLIVVDEEHETAYKQEGGVPYHGRDMAVLMGSLGGFPVVLSSATPSLESLVNVDRGRYGRILLRRRHGAASLPEVSLIDLRETPPERGSWLSPPLVEAASKALERGEQALFFLNRRGYAPLTLCRACGHRLQCPDCSAWLVQHRAHGRLMCHHCGHEEPLPRRCPSCGEEGRMTAVGPGVERLAEEAARRWPEARIATLSSDLHRGPALRRLLEAIAGGEYDIVVGTQLVAKGHHFPKLTMVGVVDADLALETADPRAAERTWQLLAQVAGRAGRAERPGRALIQTWMSDHPLMQALARGDRDGFVELEKRMRAEAAMPPFGQLAAIIVSGTDIEALQGFCRRLSGAVPPARDILVLGPAPAPIARRRGRHRMRYLVKAARGAGLQAFLRAWLGSMRPPAGLRLEVDVDPYSFL